MTSTAHRPSPPVPTREDAGAVLFGRYAFPPNDKGYCGPDRAAELLERVSERAAGHALEEVARGFAGAWPYLELISQSLGRAPLDIAVVRTYWLGGPGLGLCGGAALVGSLETRFRPRLSRLEFERLAAAARAGATPHHSFHVLGVYPWVGLLREGHVEQPLEVLDRCRIREGRVLAVDGDHALVRSRPLVWDGVVLSVGSVVVERVRLRRDGHALARPIAPGDWVSMHWDWICDRLDPVDVAHLRAATAHELAAVNGCAYAAPAAVLA